MSEEKKVQRTIERRIKHPVYGKYIRRTSKVLAHDASNECKAGDRVSISECRPMSKNKSWSVVNVVERTADK
jgi:small subunit ribosomal protein S17